VASLAIGVKFGAAKKADMVIVKVERVAEEGQGLRVSGVLRGLSLVAKDITEHGLMGKAVINMSLDVYRPSKLLTRKPPLQPAALKKCLFLTDSNAL
jgi:hypothetical protein